MKSLDSFLSRILPHTPACPDITAKEALLDTAIAFCEKTLLVQQTLSPIDTVDGTLEYELMAPKQQAVVLPIGVWFKTRYLEAVPAHAIRDVQAFTTQISGTAATEGSPTQYFWTAPNLIGLYPIPDTSEAATLTVRAALKPIRTATQLEDVLYEDWIDTLTHGTLSRLHMMKDQPWASADRALLHAREYRNGLQRARIEQSMGRVRTSVSVRMRSF
jgi:hypothetical protein